MMTKKLERVVYVSWEESERGWGCRPDGCSLHLSEEDYKQYLSDYWAGMPSDIPDEYERPVGSPGTAYVNHEIYEHIKKSKLGIRLWNHEKRQLEDEGKIKYSPNITDWIRR